MIPSASYRDPRYAASLRIQQIHEQRDGDEERIPDELADLYARRKARTWAGAVALGGAIVMVFAVALQAMISLGTHTMPGPPPTLFLLLAVVGSAATYFIGRAVAARRLSAEIGAAFAEGDDPLSRLARIEEDGARRVAIARIERAEKGSLSLPMMGFALLAPLSIHFVLWLAVGRGAGLDAFDAWIRISIPLVGLAHVVLAVLCRRFAHRLAASTLAELEEPGPPSGWKAFGWTVLAACLPGAIALLIPPIIVAATGVCFIAPLFNFIRSTAYDERRLLHDHAPSPAS